MSNCKEKLIVFDTTLRDGEQSPGVTLTVKEKLEIAKQLSRLGVDVCEAGFPIASQGDFDAVHAIATQVGPLTTGRNSPMVICALARALEGDILRAFNAIEPAPRRRIHTFLATSDIHLTHKLKISREECVKRAVAAVRYIKSLGIEDIEFSPEDAGRSDKEFLVQVLDGVVAAGATTLNIPDTVGYNTPEEFGELIKYLVENVKQPDSGPKIIFSTHCHNDLGLATANTLSGIRNGARQVEVTMNGIGERAGNTSLEEVIMTIYTHPTVFPVFHEIDTQQIYNSSQLVTKRTGMPIQPNKAIVGANAFAHESGIHQDGYLKNKSTYEIISPEVIGVPAKALVLGKHSGRNAVKARIELISTNTLYAEHLEDAGLFEAVFVKFKTLADSKKSPVTDLELFGLLDEFLNIDSSKGDKYQFKALQVTCGTEMVSTATVTILDTQNEDGKALMDAATGPGAIDAVFSAIDRLVGVKGNILAKYEVQSVTEGSDSLAHVTVRLHRAETKSKNEVSENGVSVWNGTEVGELVQGQGTDYDVIIASAKAYLNAINRMVGVESRRSGDGEFFERNQNI